MPRKTKHKQKGKGYGALAKILLPMLPQLLPMMQQPYQQPMYQQPPMYRPPMRYY